ncbi:MAG: hypothetical protein HYS08_06830 [Chlamydiae bacterium]|nr:hypothetical protein [Chlamydiota bacterium]MBI3265545.1 hypothetical protein [Chlamydiota bacterium]
MKNVLAVTEMARHFAEYINRVAYRGECFVLLRGKKAVAEIKPVLGGKRLRELPDILKSLSHLSEEEAVSFRRDVDLLRRKSRKESLRDPWAS